MALLPFRLLSAAPAMDGETWDITGQLHQDTWYEVAYGQNPVPFQQAAPGQQRGIPYPWRPLGEQGGIFDALYPSLYSFTADVDTSVYPATVTLGGSAPVNVPASGQPPVMPLQATTAATGGTIAPGTYLLALTLDYPSGPVSHTVTAVVPAGTSTNTITISGIRWPDDGTHHTTACLFAGTSILRMVNHFNSAFWTGSSPDSNGNPTVITLPAILPDGLGLPDNAFHRFVIEESAIEHGGIWGDVVTSASGADATFAGSGGAWTTNMWAGRVLSLYYRPGASPQPILNLTVASNTTDTLTLTHGTVGGFLPDDVVVMRAAGDHITSTTIGDDGFVNNYSPSGVDAASEPGRLIVIVAGTGAGQPPKTVLSATSGGIFTIAQPWDVTPDATSTWIVVHPKVTQSTTKAVTNAGTSASVVGDIASIPAITSEAQSLLIQVATADDSGNSWPMRYQPFREIYIPAQNTGSSDGAVYTVPNIANVFTPDLSQGLNQRVLLVANSTINAPINAPSGTSLTWTLIIDQDTTGGWNAVLDAEYFYSANLLGTATLSTRSQSTWIHDQAGKDSLSYVITDQPIPA